MPDNATISVGFNVADAKVTVAPQEHDNERDARLANEHRAALLADIKSAILFVVVLIALLWISALCSNTIFDQTTDVETKKWAQTMLTALVSGGLSFLLGRAIGSR